MKLPRDLLLMSNHYEPDNIAINIMAEYWTLADKGKSCTTYFKRVDNGTLIIAFNYSTRLLDSTNHFITLTSGLREFFCEAKNLGGETNFAW